MFALTIDHLAADKGGDIAFDLLHQAARTGREVIDHVRRLELQARHVDDVEIGLVALRHHTAVQQAHRLGRVASTLRRRFLRTVVGAKGLTASVLSYEEIGTEARPALVGVVPI